VDVTVRVRVKVSAANPHIRFWDWQWASTLLVTSCLLVSLALNLDIGKACVGSCEKTLTTVIKPLTVKIKRRPVRCMSQVVVYNRHDADSSIAVKT